jgi:RND family efflux transporter MFP subunit
MCISSALALLLLPATACKQSEPGKSASPNTAKTNGAVSTTAGIRVIHPERRDIRMLVVQPGTIQAFESTPIYSRISGYVQKYNYNIGDRVKAGDVLIDMWIPDYIEAHAEKVAAVHRATVQIDVAKSALRAAESKVRTALAQIESAKAGVKRAQASYTRWESEYKRLETLVTQRVLDVQVRDETYRQFEEAAAARDQAEAMVHETMADYDKAVADRDEARVNVEAAEADLSVAKAAESQAKVVVDYGKIKAPYDGVITQRNVSPGDYLEPGMGPRSLPLFILEQTDPVRVFVGVPELASHFITESAKARINFQAIPGAMREGKVARSGFALNPFTRTLQTEIDIPNADGHLHPGWYATVTIAVERKGVWTVPSNAIGFQGSQSNYVFVEQNGKPVRTPVIIGISDDTHTELLKKYNAAANTNDWPEPDGSERVMVGNLDVLAAQARAGTAESVDSTAK